ncbi:MAG: hypothetical protein ACLR1W_10465 [Agathobacter rectalis]
MHKGEQMWDYLLQGRGEGILFTREKGINGKVYCIGGRGKTLKDYIEDINAVIGTEIVWRSCHGPRQVMYLCADIQDLVKDRICTGL